MRKSTAAFDKVIEAMNVLEEALKEDQETVSRAEEKMYRIKQEKLRAEGAIEDKSKAVRVRLDNAHHVLTSSKPSTIEAYDALYAEYKDALLAYEPFREEYEALLLARKQEREYYLGAKNTNNLLTRSLRLLEWAKEQLDDADIKEEYFQNSVKRAEEYLGGNMKFNQEKENS